MRQVEFKLNHEIARGDVKNIKNSLDRLRGMEHISVNRTDGLVKVEYSLPLTEDKIVSCIENGGHKINFKKY